jgi:tetratricopeptide (TPR) repeat protein
MRAFIIRPFGKKKDLKGNEIDFDQIAKDLIDPALTAIGAEGRETLDIVESGNIRVDMFRRLLTADLVVADLSIHNANVFYELGIRHALRDHGTLMLRSDADAFPFDLQTDRYFTYDKNNPAASVKGLTESLRAIEAKARQDFNAKDSPVFTSLPKLKEPESWQFNPVPQDFGEDVAKALARKQAGDLVLFSDEIKGFEWESAGWRVVGKAQFDVNATAGAKATWEHVLRLDAKDLESNIRLGTLYERLGDLESSTQALERALLNTAISQDERAEAYALIGRNSKTRWRREWESKPASERTAVALRSRYLQESFKNYVSAFDEHLNHFYSGLNALAMLKIMIALAELQPNVWTNEFPDDDEAARTLKTHKEHAIRLQSGVQLSLDAAFKQLERQGKKDVWAEISKADLAFLTTNAPKRVASAYEKALAGAPEFARAAARQQLAIFRDLGVMTDNLAEAFQVVGDPPPLPEPGVQPPPKPERKRVLVFAGHMIDAPGRTTPRFPADKESVAREEIKKRVLEEMNDGPGVAAAYAGGASGGDILFQEVCAELGIETRLYLAIQPQTYVNTSVNKAEGNWVDRFWKLHKAHADRNQVRILSESTDVTDERDYLPAWLHSKKDYGIWQRNNLWMLYNALAESCDNKTGDPNLTLIALWDGEKGDGPGGTGDLVDKVKRLGGRNKIIKTRELFGLQAQASTEAP